MRSEQEMLELILGTARDDERIRAVIMNGSRANPDAPWDFFQDFDIVYIVTEVSSFKRDPNWIKRFGEMMILQMPDDMRDPPPSDDERFAYLMQFTDGNRIDLSIHPIAKLDDLGEDSLSLLLLDKDGIIEPFAPASESNYLPKPPTAKASRIAATNSGGVVRMLRRDCGEKRYSTPNICSIRQYEMSS
jgi:aminoglycoside 6-adenylyltransferase